MAIAAEVNFEGSPMEKYFESIKLLDATPEGRHPDPGCLFHWVTETDGGYRVTDVWQTQDQFEKFIEERVRPVTEQLGVSPPQVKIVTVANYLTAG